MRLVCSLVLLLAGLHLTCAQLSLGAFNIRVFGENKAKNVTIMESIATIVRRYDIIVIQEVRDNNPATPVINKLMDFVNQASSDYDCKFSAPLGESNQKERYVFLYRKSKVTFRDSYQYPDTAKTFSRPPFVVKFRAANFEFALVPLHSKPSAAVKEIDALVDVVAAVTALPTWNNNMVLLGDFNAGCNYVTAANWKNIRLRTQTNNYKWLIDDRTYTNLALKCPYDRIVATTAMYNHVVKGSARVYNFKLALGLSQKEAENISDHFPVEVQLQ